MINVRNHGFSVFSLSKALFYVFAFPFLGSWKFCNALELSARTRPVNLLGSNSTADQGDAGSSSKDSLPQIYAGTTNSGIRAISLGNSSVTKVIDAPEFEQAFAFDSLQNRLYYSTWASIYRANLDGCDALMVYENITRSFYFGATQGLRVDWVTGNLYGTTDRGLLFVCADTAEGLLKCINLVFRIKGRFRAIAVNPLEGTVYWTGMHFWNGVGNSIWRAGMDGSNLAIIVPGPYESIGCLAIHYGHSRLYWTEAAERKLRSSDLEGGNVTTIVDFVQIDPDFAPFRIALHKERIYWADFFSGAIQSSSMAGQDITTEYNSSDRNYYLAFQPGDVPFASRPNDCENHISTCSGICVLTPSGSRCVLEEFQQDEDSVSYLYPERYVKYSE